MAIKPGFSIYNLGMVATKTTNFYVDLKYTLGNKKLNNFYLAAYYQNFDTEMRNDQSSSIREFYFYNADYLGVYLGYRMKNFDFWLGGGLPVSVNSNWAYETDTYYKRDITSDRTGTAPRLRAGMAFCINFMKID